MSKVKSTIHQWQQELADSLANEEDRKIMAGLHLDANKKWTRKFKAEAQKDLDRLDASNAAPPDIPTPVTSVLEGWWDITGTKYQRMYNECYRPVTSVLVDRLRSKDLRMKTLRDEVDLWETRAEDLRVAFCDTVEVLRQMRVEYEQVTRDDFPLRGLNTRILSRPFDKKFLEIIVLCGSCSGSGVSEWLSDDGDRRDVEPGGDYEDQCEDCLGTGYDTQNITNRSWQRREYKS